MKDYIQMPKKNKAAPFMKKDKIAFSLDLEKKKKRKGKVKDLLG